MHNTIKIIGVMLSVIGAILLSSCVVQSDRIDVPYKPMLKDEFDNNVRMSKIGQDYTEYQMASIKKELNTNDAVCVGDLIIVYDEENLNNDTTYNIFRESAINTDSLVLIDTEIDPEEMTPLILKSTCIGFESSNRILPTTDYIKSKLTESPLKYITIQDIVKILVTS